MSERSDRIEKILSEGGADEEALGGILEEILASFDCAVGTIHRLDDTTGMLKLCCQRGLPPQLLPTVKLIPVGKGMAGLAAERREPVQVCNLQHDSSGDARPRAKLTQMEGSLALPLLVDGELRGTLGVAKPVVYEFTPEEVAELTGVAQAIGRRLVAASK